MLYNVHFVTLCLPGSLPIGDGSMRIAHNGHLGYAYVIAGILVISWDDGETEWFR